MVIDEAGAGLVVQCPKCGRDVSVPKSGASKPGPGTKSAVVSPEDREKTVALKWIPPSGSADEKSKK